jgi:hypothetical protein
VSKSENSIFLGPVNLEVPFKWHPGPTSAKWYFLAYADSPFTTHPCCTGYRTLANFLWGVETLRHIFSWKCFALSSKVAENVKILLYASVRYCMRGQQGFATKILKCGRADLTSFLPTSWDLKLKKNAFHNPVKFKISLPTLKQQVWDTHQSNQFQSQCWECPI